MFKLAISDCVIFFQFFRATKMTHLSCYKMFSCTWTPFYAMSLCWRTQISCGLLSHPRLSPLSCNPRFLISLYNANLNKSVLIIFPLFFTNELYVGYFKGRNFRRQKLSRFWPFFAKVSAR